MSRDLQRKFYQRLAPSLAVSKTHEDILTLGYLACVNDAAATTFSKGEGGWSCLEKKTGRPNTRDTVLLINDFIKYHI